MRRFDPSSSLLAGMDTTVLNARLTQMQNDYLDISAGRKVVSASYTQGDGGKNVTYDRTTLPQLAMAIRLLQQQLGIISQGRHALSVGFR